MSRRMFSTTCYLDEEQLEKLRELSDRTKVSVAEYVRQGVELALAEHERRAGIIFSREDQR